MADSDFLDDSNKLVGALGSTFVKKIDKMQAKQEAMQRNVVEVKQTLPKYNVEVTQAIKQVAESQKQNISSQQIVELGKSILQAVTGKVTSLTQATVKEFLPIESELKQVVQLLQSNKEEDNEQAFKTIDTLQNKLGIDLKSFSKDLGDGIDKLFEIAEKKKTEKEERKRIHEEKVSELTKERDILRERGINTYVDEKNMQLEIKTFAQEKLEKLQIIEEEKRLQSVEKQLNREIKQAKSTEFINNTTRDKLIEKEKTLTEDQKKLLDKKEKAGMTSGKDMEQGPFAQTLGAAYNQFRLMGKEIFGFGKSIMGLGKSAFGFIGNIGSSFKGLSTSLSSFTKSTESSGKSVGLFGNIMKVTIIPILAFLGSIIMTFISAIMSGISSILGIIGRIGGGIGNMLFGGAKAAAGAAGAGTAVAGGVAAGGAAATVAATGIAKTEEGKKLANQVNEETQQTGFSMTGAMDGDLAMGTLLANPETIKPLADKKGLPKAKQNVDLNKLSVDNMSNKEAGDNNNVVVAPNNIVNNSNQSTVMGMPPINQDRSFINLNAPAIAI
jgi:hypothetical protein